MIDRVFNEYSKNDENIRLYNGFKEYNKDRLSSQTMDIYNRDILSFLNYLEKGQDYLRVRDLTEEELEEYFFRCQESGIGVEHIKRRFSSINTFLNFLLKHKWIEENPMKYIKKSNYLTYELNQAYFNKEELEYVKKRLSCQSNKQLELYVMLTLSSGIRFTCIPNIKWSDIDFEGRCINNIQERPYKTTSVFFSEDVKKIFFKLKKDRGIKNIDSEYVFLSQGKNKTGKRIDKQLIRTYATRVGKYAGYDEFTPFSLRRTFAYSLLEAGFSKEEVSTLLNYRSDRASRLYSQVNIQEIIAKKDLADI